jgi:hypothetical protein
LGYGATGGAAVVIDTGAMCGVGRVEGTARGATEVLGAARGQPKLAKLVTKERRRS